MVIPRMMGIIGGFDILIRMACELQAIKKNVDDICRDIGLRISNDASTLEYKLNISY